MEKAHVRSSAISNANSLVKAVLPLIVLIGGTAVIGYCYASLVKEFVATDMAYFYAVIPTIFTVIGLYKILYGLSGRRIENGAIRKALSNRAPKDGEVYAFLGTLESDGEPLKTPFSGEDCIQYEYTLSETIVLTGRREGPKEEIRWTAAS